MRAIGFVLCVIIGITAGIRFNIKDFTTVKEKKSELPKELILKYETENYSQGLYRKELFATNLCVGNENIYADLKIVPSLHGAASFSVTASEILYAENLHIRLEPASITKILTALIAIEHGDLTEIVTVRDGAFEGLHPASSTANLRYGDQLTLLDLIYGLMLPSGNDSSIVIAEYIAGSVPAFSEMMNDRAAELGATNSYFSNPHGLSSVEHYTTIYDLYLIFNKCIQSDIFIEIISADTYTANVRDRFGNEKILTWENTNPYLLKQTGTLVEAANYMIVGKTGTTNAAGACLILFTKDFQENEYITIVMGAESRSTRIESMNTLLRWMLLS